MKLRYIRKKGDIAEIYGGDARTLKHLMTTFVEKAASGECFSVAFAEQVMSAVATELELQDVSGADYMRQHIQMLSEAKDEGN